MKIFNAKTGDVLERETKRGDVVTIRVLTVDNYVARYVLYDDDTVTLRTYQADSRDKTCEDAQADWTHVRSIAPEEEQNDGAD